MHCVASKRDCQRESWILIFAHTTSGGASWPDELIVAIIWN
jgi:hypothetical protein